MYGFGTPARPDTCWYWSPCWLCGHRTYSHYKSRFYCDNDHDPVQWSRMEIPPLPSSSTPIPDPETMGPCP